MGPYHNGYQVPWLPTRWKAEKDTSIKPTTPSRKGCEFVSPKLKGEAGVAEVEAALDAINSRGAKVNSSCGLHVTIEWNGDAAALARLISLVGNHERAIFASTGTRRREQTTYTKQIKQYGNKVQAKERCESDRYDLLNLTHLARGKNRIEFRAFAGTLNKTKGLGYLMLCLGLVELALNTTRCSDWDYTKREGTKSCWDRPGAGPRRDGTQPPLLPTWLDQGLVQGRAAQQDLRADRNARHAGGQDEAAGTRPEVRRGGTGGGLMRRLLNAEA
ncbi:MAG: amidoligase family protein [Pirellulales bacterium]